MDTAKVILISVIVSVVVFLLGVGLQAAFNQTTFGTQVQNDLFYFTGGIKVGGQGQFSIDTNGVTTLASTTVGGSLTYSANCATATWNPASIGPYGSATSTTSTIITLPGAVLGSLCEGSLTSATSTAADFACDVNGAASATLNLYNTGGSALDLATGTARVCLVK